MNKATARKLQKHLEKVAKLQEAMWELLGEEDGEDGVEEEIRLSLSMIRNCIETANQEITQGVAL
ncbi:hypothetical protein ACFFLM_04290 [Deinococcus oregonensis]|uniref:Uncharacterized protein n=1 Tax=Deinococcus oregonensis TaxID=1805970 RepID=A0ABV6AUL4_9DEIO